MKNFNKLIFKKIKRGSFKFKPVVFIGLFFWGWIFGPVGMILSVPLTMALKMALESDKETQWLAILIGSETDALHKIKSN